MCVSVTAEGVYVYPGTELAAASFEGGKVKVGTKDGKEVWLSLDFFLPAPT